MRRVRPRSSRRWASRAPIRLRRRRKTDSNLWFRISRKRFFYTASEPQTGREPQRFRPADRPLRPGCPPRAAQNQSRDKSGDCAARINDKHGCHSGFEGAIKGIVRKQLDRPIAGEREDEIANRLSKQRQQEIGAFGDALTAGGRGRSGAAAALVVSCRSERHGRSVLSSDRKPGGGGAFKLSVAAGDGRAPGGGRGGLSP
jgi:hypothetical protein